MKSIAFPWSMSGLAIAVCIALGQAGWAQQAAERAQSSQAGQAGAATVAGSSTTGSVVSIDGDRLVTAHPDGSRHTHIIGASARITLDGKPAKLSDLKTGDTIVLTSPADRPDSGLSITATRGQPTAVPAPAAPPPPAAGQTYADRRASGQAGLGVLVAPSDVGKGVRVVSVELNSPAARAGLAAGDLITALDKKEVNSTRDLIAEIRAKQPGAQVEIAFTRADQAKTVTATLTDRHAVIPPGVGFAEPGAGPGMALPPGGSMGRIPSPREFRGQLSQHNQHLESLLQQVLSEVQQLRREVQDLRGRHEPATSLREAAPRPERK